jgi:serine/threonine protein kinase
MRKTRKFGGKANMADKKVNMTGGKAIAAGAYGCVFDPALKCNNKTKREKGKVTKLMTTVNATKEFVEIAEIESKLRRHKKYKDYFLTYGAEICTPSKLTATDLQDFSTKCKVLPGITKTNINTQLDTVTALNLPHGGLPVDDYIYENGSFDKIYKLHKSLVNLLRKGIVPMNKKHLFHSDIKDTNVMVDQTTPEIKTRLIDWGLFTEYKPNKAFPFPKKWTNRPLQFNVPFSVILFSDKFTEKYSKYLKDGGLSTEEQLKPFVIEYINFWMQHRGAGHYKFINEIMTALFINSLEDEPPETRADVIEKQITMDYIVNYLVDVLVHFTRFNPDGTLSLREYIDTIYINIVDVWGFITVYYPIIEMLSASYSKLSENQIKLFKQIQFIFVEYLYNPRHEPIDMTELYGDLSIVGKLLHKAVNGNLETYTSPTPSPSNSETVDYVSRKSRPNTM